MSLDDRSSRDVSRSWKWGSIELVLDARCWTSKSKGKEDLSMLIDDPTVDVDGQEREW